VDFGGVVHDIVPIVTGSSLKAIPLKVGTLPYLSLALLAGPRYTVPGQRWNPGETCFNRRLI
ncbi:uncharacterized protein PgNI_07309, partial [Pyricularia grisea]|uniref:Uncharacterized protein n=1 Tax=Pyricularia grisea TaxID=148305 RepID=A0A6P8B2P8_PYRGI